MISPLTASVFLRWFPESEKHDPFLPHTLKPPECKHQKYLLSVKEQQSDESVFRLVYNSGRVSAQLYLSKRTRRYVPYMTNVNDKERAGERLT